MPDSFRIIEIDHSRHPICRPKRIHLPMKDVSSMEATLRTIHENKTDPVEISYLVSDLIATGKEVVGKLTTMLRHSAPEIRSAAALALGYVPYFSEGHYDVSDASRFLVHSLDDECDWVVFYSAKSLLMLEMETESEFGIAASELSKRFAGCLSSNDPVLRVMAARRLGFTRMTPEVAVPALLIALTDPIGSVRLEAAVSLSRLDLVGSDIHSKLLRRVKKLSRTLSANQGVTYVPSDLRISAA